MPEPIAALRAASFYITGGTLPPDAPSYIERQADRDLHAALLAGETCYVLNSRQMGKSSLCVRTLQRLKQEGYRTAFLDLTKFGGRNLTAEQWYAALLSEVGRELGLRSEFLAHWKENALLPPVQRLFGAITEIGLAADSSPLVIFVDEIDVTRSLPFSADEFFAAIRQVYVGRSTHPALTRIAFCLLGTATPAELIQDTRVSPFNIGKRILLQDFTAAEAAPLAQGMTRGRPVLERVLTWTGGHPYLTQRLCRAIAEEPQVGTVADVDRLCNELFLTHRAKEADDNLAFVRNRLLKSEVELAALLEMYGWMRAGKRVPDDETNPLCAVVKLSGVARVEGGLLKVRNRIYAHVFDRNWVVTHLPDAEKRRQRQAFLKGLSLAGAVLGTVLGIIGTLAGIALHEKHQAQTILKRAVASEWTAKENARRAEEASRKSDKSEREATRLKDVALRKTADAERQRSRAERQEQEAKRQREQAKRAAQKSEYQRRIAVAAQSSEKRERARNAQSLYGSDMQLAGHLWNDGNLSRVAELLEKHRPSKLDPTDRRGFDWRYQWTLLNSAPTFLEHNGGVSQSAIASDGTLLTLDADYHLRRWDRETRKPLPQADTFAVSKLLSPDGRTLALLKDYATPALILRDPLRGGERALPIPQGLRINYWLFSPNSRYLVLAGSDNTITVWDTSTGTEVHHTTNTVSAGESVALSPDGQTLATGNGDAGATLSLYDLNHPLAEPYHMSGKGHRQTITSVAFSLDGASIASADWSGNVIVWNRATRKSEHRLKSTHESKALKLLFAVGNKTLAMGSSDGLAQIWDVVHEIPLRTLPGRGGPITTLALSPSGSELLTGDEDGVAKLWDLRTMPGERYLAAENSITTRMAASSDGRILARAGATAVTLWETNHWKKLGDLFTGEQTNGVAFSRDGRLLAVGSADKTVTVWKVATRQIRHVYTDLAVSQTSHGWGPWALAFSPDGRYLAAGDGLGSNHSGASGRCEIKIWDLQTDRLAQTLAHDGPLSSLAFSPDGTLLASGGQDNRVKMWRVEGWKAAYTIHGPDKQSETGQSVFALAFAADGHTLAIGGDAGTILLVDPRSGLPRFSLHGHTDTVRGLDFTPDGKTLVSMSSDNSVRCWDLASRRETQRLAGHATQVYCGLITANGNAVVSGAQNGSILVHEAVSLQEADARDYVGAPYQAEAQARRDVLDAAGKKHWPEVFRLTSRMLTHNAESLFLLDSHAYACAQMGRYRPAAADFLRIAKSRGSGVDYWHCGMALLGAGDMAGYRRLCADMMHRISATATGVDAMYYAETCSLAPNALPDIEPALRLAEQGLKTAGPSYRDNYGRLLNRTGRHRDAIRELNAGIQADKNNDFFENWVTLAISYWKIGDYAQARHCLHQAQEEHRVAAKNGTWPDRLKWRLFGLEAERLIQ